MTEPEVGQVVIHHLDPRFGHRRVISMIPPAMTRSEFDSNPDGWQFEIGAVWRPRWRDNNGHLWEDAGPESGWNYEFTAGAAILPPHCYLEEKGWCRTLADVRSIPALRARGIMEGPGFAGLGNAYRG